MDEYKQLRRIIELFRRGVIGPSGMWIHLFEELAASDVPTFLDRLEITLQKTVLEDFWGLAAYRFTPEGISQAPAEERATREAIRDWCTAYSAKSS